MFHAKNNTEIIYGDMIRDDACLKERSHEVKTQGHCSEDGEGGIIVEDNYKVES